ncbi:poly-gamma-glutamate capsule biosynthesis protein CapA/YwtB (metallophosphatase superfamily) [Neobacillus sp. B4I6]|jgi:poly-gamma-glutamate capsule biosynthesis protein CapA/YwtB (metallophosphatase superfamily)|uniref:CapA family protein n=1 Tax=Neobacillus sp. B4I6 TaxID=3373925 RepID=UPI003D21056D
MKRNAIIPSVLIIVACVGLASYLLIQQSQHSEEDEKVYPSKEHKPRSLLMINREMTEKVTLGAIGDVLIHDKIYKDAFNGTSYHFEPMFENVKPLLEKPDVLTANQESMLGGQALGLSGYPRFNSPYELADALVQTGVDILSTANNHTLDKGEKGIKSEAAYLESIGLPHVGSFLDEKDRQNLRILNKNGIKLAFLSYTYGTNGIPVPDGKDFLVNLINRESMKEEIHRAKKQSDVVVMSIHWGNEYKRMPTKEQKDLAKFLANEGVDIIFGSHPHVLQPMEWIKTAEGKRTFVIYSLGNFISAQHGDYKDIGGLTTIDITKHVSEKGTTIDFSNPAFYPTYVASKKNHNFRVVPLEKAGSFGFRNANAKFKEIQTHMQQWLR